MATLKAVVQKPRKDGMYIVYIRVTHHKKVAYIKTDKMVDRSGLTKDGKDIKEAFVLRFTSQRICDYYDMLNRVDCENWTVQEVVAYLTKGAEDVSYSAHARVHYINIYKEGREGTAKNYKLALKSLQDYMGTDDIKFSAMTPAVLNGWIDELKKTTRRAKEQYPTYAREMWKSGVAKYNDEDRGIIVIPGNPWTKVTIPKSDTPEQDAVEPDQLRKFFATTLPESRYAKPKAQMAQEICKMMFCLAGMNTADLYYAKKEGYHDGKICYYRQKVTTKRADKGYFEIRISGLIQPLVDKYLDKTDSEWLFNFHQQYNNKDSFNANVNSGILDINMLMGIKKEEKWRAYVFRNTWATIAQNDCGASLADVDFALNHMQHKMARIYVKLNYEPVWDLNDKVIDFLFFSDDKGARVEKKKIDWEKFSALHMIKAEAYYMGKVVSRLQDTGYTNTKQVVMGLMAKMPDELAEGTVIQIRIENVDKGLVKTMEKKI